MVKPSGSFSITPKLAGSGGASFSTSTPCQSTGSSLKVMSSVKPAMARPSSAESCGGFMNEARRTRKNGSFRSSRNHSRILFRVDVSSPLLELWSMYVSKPCQSATLVEAGLAHVPLAKIGCRVAGFLHAHAERLCGWSPFWNFQVQSGHTWLTIIPVISE